MTNQDRALAKAIEEKLAQEGKRVSSKIPSPDGILAAQAINFKVNEKDTGVVILTENVRDIIRVVRNGVKVWDYEEIIYKIRNNIEIDTVNVVDLIKVSS